MRSTSWACRRPAHTTGGARCPSPTLTLVCCAQVAQAGVHLLADERKPGSVLVVLVDGSWVEPQRTRFKRRARWATAAGLDSSMDGCGGA